MKKTFKKDKKYSVNEKISIWLSARPNVELTSISGNDIRAEIIYEKKIKTNCIVAGCMNKKGEGLFIGEICSPCHEMLVSGDYSKPSGNFIAELYQRNKQLEKEVINSEIPTHDSVLEARWRDVKKVLPDASWVCKNCKLILNYRPNCCPNCRKEYFLKYSAFLFEK